jgi:RNA polymerase sigma-70 factor (ECF subfamily)
METTDIDLVLKTKNGEAESFGALYDKYSRKIYDFLFYRTHHKETAEDLTSQTFNKALEKIGQFNGQKAQFSTWLYQIAKNSLFDHYRKSRPSEDLESAWDLPSTANVETAAWAAIEIEKVKKYLTSIGKQQREIVLMRVWDGLSHKEIAEILGISEANCKTIFSRTLAKLQQDFPLIILLLVILKLF